MIAFILLGIAVAIGVAIAIVKYVPIKMQWMVSIALMSTAVLLGYLIYSGIMDPIKFNKEKKVRYAKVIDHLRMIRDAQDAHNTVTGSFAPTGQGLIKFVDTAQLAITQVRNIVEQVNKGTRWQPIMVEVERKVTDTIGYESIKEKLFTNRDYTEMMQVPGTNAQFEMQVGEIEKIIGLKVSAFEAKVDKAIVLEGLSKSLIKQEKEALGGDEVRGAFLSVGSLEEVTINGNWPPFYDKLSRQKG